MRVLNLHDLEMLGCFVQGSKPSLFKQVIEQAPKTFEDAAYLEERAILVQ